MSALLFRYQGPFSDLITGQVTALLDAALVEGRCDVATRRRLKALLVEQVQNIQRYSRDARQGSVEVGVDGTDLYVETENAIDAETKNALGARLDDLAQSDAEALRRRYRTAIHEPLDPTARGAGLGFLFLVQKSSQRLAYAFEEVPHQQYRFRLRSYTKRGTQHA